jgi:hypothetical protein
MEQLSWIRFQITKTAKKKVKNLCDDESLTQEQLGPKLIDIGLKYYKVKEK